MEPGPSQSATTTVRPAVSVVVPCFRDEAALPVLFDALRPVLEGIEGGAELVLVDDGSMDRTAAVAKDLAGAVGFPVVMVNLVRNFGQHPAVFAGLAQASGQVVVTMDSDLQYPAYEVPRLVAELSEDFPVVSGYRADRKDPFARRMITAMLTRWLNKQTHSDLKDFGSMFRAYDRSVVERMLQVTERHRYVPAVVAWLGAPVREIPVDHLPRGEQGSRYRLGGLVNMVIDLVTGYSIAPVRMVSLVGLGAAGLGFLGTLLFFVYRVAVGGGVSGTVSAFTLVFFLVGVQLGVSAMIAEYVGRVYAEAKGRPYYLVASVDSYNVVGDRADAGDVT